MYSDRDKELIAAIELQARVPLTALAGQISQKVPTLRQRLKRLINDGVLKPRRAYLNLYPLGYVNYIIYFSAAAGTQNKRAELLKSLVQNKAVTWLCEVGGDYEYGVSIAAQSPLEVASFLDSLHRSFPDMLYDKSLSVRLSISTWPRQYLSKRKIAGVALYQGPAAAASIDHVDGQILDLAAEAGAVSDRELARRISLPVSTLHRRLRALEKKGLIAGYQYLFDPSHLGLNSYRFLIEARPGAPDLLAEFKAFAARHIMIHKFVHCMGTWDFELEADADNAAAASRLKGEIYEKFGARIVRIRVVPLIQNLPASMSLAARAAR